MNLHGRRLLHFRLLKSIIFTRVGNMDREGILTRWWAVGLAPRFNFQQALTNRLEFEMKKRRWR